MDNSSATVRKLNGKNQFKDSTSSTPKSSKTSMHLLSPIQQFSFEPIPHSNESVKAAPTSIFLTSTTQEQRGTQDTTLCY